MEELEVKSIEIEGKLFEVEAKVVEIEGEVLEIEVQSVKIEALEDQVSALEGQVSGSEGQESKLYYNNLKSCTLLDKEDHRNYTESYVFPEVPLSIGNISITCSNHFVIYYDSAYSPDKNSVGIISDEKYWKVEGLWCDTGRSNILSECIGASQLEPYEAR